MKKTGQTIIGLLLALIAGTVGLQGAVVMQTEQWTTSMSGWQNEPGPGGFGGAASVVQDAVLGTPAVHINFAAEGEIGLMKDELIYANAGSSGGNFVGDYAALGPSGTINAGFRFFAQDTQPSSLSFFFWSSTSDRFWQMNLALPTVGSWQYYQVPMYYTAGWVTPGGDAGQFAADLLDVDQIGIWVTRSGGLGAQDYGLDDFELTVPEPRTYIMMAFALVSLAYTFRRQLNESLALVRVPWKT